MYNYPYGDNQQINLNWIISEIIALHQRLDPDYTAPTFTQIYPFSETQQLNLDWILTELKALKELAPPPSGLSSNDVLNDSTVSGDTVTDALDALLAAFGNLDSDDIANNSTVSGSTVTDALDALLAAFGNLDSDDIANESTASGATVTDALSNLNGAITSKLPHLESTGDTTDRLAEINAALAQGGCVLGEGTFYISDTIVMPNNASLIGCGVNTVISLVSSATNKSAIKMAQFNTIENLKLYGAKAATSTIGNVHGIEWSGDYSTSTNPYTQPRLGKISNVYIDSFSGGGIYCYNTGYETYTSLDVDNVTIYSCAVGIYIPYWSEYHQFTSVKVWNCYYGCINNGGNNSFVNCDFSDSKEIGFKIENPNDANPNNTHGMCVGCLFNHIKNNTGNAVVISDTHNGFAFVGCQLFYGNISITNSTGIVFDGCICGAISIAVTGTGVNIFSNNTFHAQPTVNVTSATVFDNCYERTNNSAISPFRKNGSITVQSGVTATLYNAVAKQIGNIVSLSGWFNYTATSTGLVQDVLEVTGVDMPLIPPGSSSGFLRGTISYGNYAYDLTDVCYFILESDTHKLRITPQATGQKAYVFNIVYMI